MAQELSTAEPETEIVEAYQLMLNDQIRRLPVVASDRLVGFDLLSNTEQTLSQKLEQMTAGEVMTPNPVTVAEDATIGEAAQKMLENKISGLPVLDPVGVNLVGIITESDI
ncbi:CBS domain-containing protein, partial [Candidatus Poribacteria bacterium]|nr:CBS domain-containing protein [Candidatus Poribacteria bacterium]